MAQQTVTQEGVFTNSTKTKINANFTELYATTAGGALANTKILVGNGSGVAAAVLVSGDATLANTGALTVATVNGVKFASGITALDGGNPTTVATGLTTVTSFVCTLVRSTAVSSGTAFLTHAAPSGANVDVYGWVLAGSASTGTEDFHWLATGT